MGVGIDYGKGLVNTDLKTDIRYGVISQHSISGEALNDMELEYPFSCPNCGSESLVKSRSANYEYFCQSCRTWHMEYECHGDESIGMTYHDSEYDIQDCLDSDLMVTKSPYFTYAQFCSPCVPGAGNLDNPMPDGVKTYCLGPDWFDEYDPCPYPIYKVKTGELVLAAA
jgi:predicted RNA-binding Zn-ribbon protein involved in translation (DUF1610 family)